MESKSELKIHFELNTFILIHHSQQKIENCKTVKWGTQQNHEVVVKLNKKNAAELPIELQKKILKCIAEGMPIFSRINEENIFAKATNLKLRNQIFLYPGSFNPFHQGHKECISQSLKFGSVLILPDYNPQKTINPTSPLKHFLELREQLQSFSHTEVYPGFLALETTNPTSQWLPNLPIGFRNLIMGDDSFLSLQSWINSKKVIENLDEILVIPRNGTLEQFETQIKALKLIHPELKAHYLSSHPYQKLSSTNLR